jgi:hypothetical protein
MSLVCNGVKEADRKRQDGGPPLPAIQFRHIFGVSEWLTKYINPNSL